MATYASEDPFAAFPEVPSHDPALILSPWSSSSKCFLNPERLKPACIPTGHGVTGTTYRLLCQLVYRVLIAPILGHTCLTRSAGP